MFPRVDFPWVFQLDAESRRLAVYEDYTCIETVEFDANGRGGTCACDGYWEAVKSLPEAPRIDLGQSSSALYDGIIDMLATTWPGGASGELCGAHRQASLWVTRLQLGPYALLVPDQPVGCDGALVFRDADRRVGLIDLRPIVTPHDVQRLLTQFHGDLELEVMDDYRVYRSMRVTDRMTQPERECTVDEAREVDADAGPGDKVFWPIPMQWGHLVLRWAAHRQQGLPTRALL